MPDIDERLLIPKALTARALGISVQAFAQWGLQAKERKGREALYYLPEVLAEARRRWEKKDEEKGTGLVLFDEQARLAKEKADATALDNAERRGDLADLGTIAEELGKLFGVLRAQLLAAPSKLAPLVSPENPNRARDIIAGEVERVLREVAAYQPGASASERLADDDGDAAAVTAAPASHGDAVVGSASAAKSGKQRGARSVQ